MREFGEPRVMFSKNGNKAAVGETIAQGNVLKCSDSFDKGK